MCDKCQKTPERKSFSLWSVPTMIIPKGITSLRLREKSSVPSAYYYISWKTATFQNFCLWIALGFSLRTQPFRPDICLDSIVLLSKRLQQKYNDNESGEKLVSRISLLSGALLRVFGHERYSSSTNTTSPKSLVRIWKTSGIHTVIRNWNLISKKEMHCSMNQKKKSTTLTSHVDTLCE